MEAYGLGQRLDIPTDQAAEILDAYFEGFPNVHAYMDETVREAQERGYTTTIFGRRRQIPELASDNFRIRQMGERMAQNAPVQGSAADIFKLAMIDLDAALDAAELRVADDPHRPRRARARGAGRRARGGRGGRARDDGERRRVAGAARRRPGLRTQLGRSEVGEFVFRIHLLRGVLGLFVVANDASRSVPRSAWWPARRRQPGTPPRHARPKARSSPGISAASDGLENTSSSTDPTTVRNAP